MSRIDELIAKYCPNGVEYKPVGIVLRPLPKGTLKQDQLEKDGQYPVINSGRDFYGYYSLFNNDCEAIVIASRGEYAGFISYMSGKFWAGGLCYPYAVCDTSILLPKYVFYYLKSQEQYIMDTLVSRGSIPALNKSDMDKVQIPVPPLAVQEEIVNILDSFTLLEAELEAELEARKKQYEHYREELLNPANMKGEVKVLAIWEITNWDKKFNGVDKSMQEKVIKYPYLLADELAAMKQPAGDVFLLSTGESIGWTTEDVAGDKLCKGEVVTIPWGKSRPVVECMKYYNGKFVTADNRIATSKDTSVLSNKYLFYWLQTKGAEIDKFYRGAGIQHPNMKSVLTMKIQLPSLAEQKRIVGILDRFDALVNDISVGLPAELNARRQQYEYYRYKLLNFEPLAAA